MQLTPITLNSLPIELLSNICYRAQNPSTALVSHTLREATEESNRLILNDIFKGVADRKIEPTFDSNLSLKEAEKLKAELEERKEPFLSTPAINLLFNQLSSRFTKFCPSERREKICERFNIKDKIPITSNQFSIIKAMIKKYRKLSPLPLSCNKSPLPLLKHG